MKEPGTSAPLRAGRAVRGHHTLTAPGSILHKRKLRHNTGGRCLQSPNESKDPVRAGHRHSDGRTRRRTWQRYTGVTWAQGQCRPTAVNSVSRGSPRHPGQASGLHDAHGNATAVSSRSFCAGPSLLFPEAAAIIQNSQMIAMCR